MLCIFVNANTWWLGGIFAGLALCFYEWSLTFVYAYLPEIGSSDEDRSRVSTYAILGSNSAQILLMAAVAGMLAALEPSALVLSNTAFDSGSKFWSFSPNNTEYLSGYHFNETKLQECSVAYEGKNLCSPLTISGNGNYILLNSTSYTSDIGIYQSISSSNLGSRKFLFTSKMESNNPEFAELRIFENDFMTQRSALFDKVSGGSELHITMFDTKSSTRKMGFQISTRPFSFTKVDDVSIYSLPSWYTRLAVFICGFWFLTFALISFTHFSPRPASRSMGNLNRNDNFFRRFWKFIIYVNSSLLGSIRHCIENRVLAIWFIAYSFFSAGTTTVVSLAGTYLKEQIRLSGSMTGIVLLGSQLIGIPGAFLGHFIGKKIGYHAATCLSYCMFALSVILGYLLWLDETTPMINVLIVLFVFGIGGGSGIALTRASLSGMIPKGREAEYMGLYNFFNKVLSASGPALFTAVNESIRSFRLAFLSLLSFFLVAITLQILVIIVAKRSKTLDAKKVVSIEIQRIDASQ